jgi:hypothetical protein
LALAEGPGETKNKGWEKQNKKGGGTSMDKTGTTSSVVIRVPQVMPEFHDVI